MKRLVKAGSYYLWALVIREYLGIAALALLVGTAMASLTYLTLVLVQTFCWR